MNTTITTTTNNNINSTIALNLQSTFKNNNRADRSEQFSKTSQATNVQNYTKEYKACKENKVIKVKMQALSF